MPKKQTKRKTIALPADLYAQCKAIGKTQPFITSANAVVVGYVKCGILGESPLHTDRLAEIIREVDGDHKLGAGALAERIIEKLNEGAKS